VFVTIDPSLCPPKPKKPREPKWELIYIFQNVWVAKLPWAKVVLGANGKMIMVRCKICTNVENQEKLFMPKFDGLYKHVGHCKVTIVKLGVAMGVYYMSSMSQHLNNERQYALKHGKTSILDQMEVGLLNENDCFCNL
jgi:hypothetical protein